MKLTFKVFLRVVSVIFFSIVGILLLEVGLAVFDISPYPERLPVGIYDPDPQTGFVFKANSEDTHSSYEFKTTVRINSMGLRDDDSIASDTKPELFIVGDSFAQGYGLDLKDTYAKRLESILGKRVVNLGIDSYGTREALVRYDRYLNKFSEKPKVAVLSFYVGNDYYDNERTQNGPLITVSNGYRVDVGLHVKVDGDTAYRVDDKTNKIIDKRRNNAFYPRVNIENETIKGMKIFNVVSGLLYANGKSREYLIEKGYSKKAGCGLPIAIPGLFDLQYDFEQSSHWEITRGLLEEFFQMSEHNGVTPFVMIIPSKYQVTPEILKFNGDCFDLDKFNKDASVDVMAHYLETRGIDYVDLLSEFSKIDKKSRGRLYYKIDSHFTKHGASVVANILADKIKSINIKTIRSK